MWVIWNKTKKAYVARVGYKCSYTRSIRRMRIFHTKAEADADCCGNEVVLEMVLELAGEG